MSVFYGTVADAYVRRRTPVAHSYISRTSDWITCKVRRMNANAIALLIHVPGTRTASGNSRPVAQPALLLAKNAPLFGIRRLDLGKGMGQPSPFMPLLAVFAAITSLLFTDIWQWFRLLGRARNRRTRPRTANMTRANMTRAGMRNDA